MPLFFGELRSGRAKTLEAKIRQEKRETFLKTNELSIEGENNARPARLLAAPKRLCEADCPSRTPKQKPQLKAPPNRPEGRGLASYGQSHNTRHVILLSRPES